LLRYSVLIRVAIGKRDWYCNAVAHGVISSAFMLLVDLWAGAKLVEVVVKSRRDHDPLVFPAPLSTDDTWSFAERNSSDSTYGDPAHFMPGGAVRPPFSGQGMWW